MENDLNRQIKLLLIEDVEDDAVLLVHHLKKAGLDVQYTRVEDEHHFRDELGENKWDIIISDYSMPKFDGLSALKIYQEYNVDIPFIIVSGTIGEDVAVKAMREGAHDYIMKNYLDRLVPAIERELREAVIREEKRQAQADLHANQERLRVLIKNSTDIIVIIDEKGVIKFASPSIKTVLGNPPHRYCNSNIIDQIHPDDKKSALILFNKYRKKWLKDVNKLELRLRHKNNNWVVLEIFIQDMLNNAIIRGFVINARDITERRQNEEKIKRDLVEKEILLKEIHHRVKNNLQVISSLLSLQSRYVKDKRALEIFNESCSRVRSIALVHEELYQSSDFVSIEFESYIKKLAFSLFQASSINPGNIELDISIKNVSLGLDLAVPCGLILNELITNAIKHAFTGGFQGKGRISVSINRLKHGKVEMTVHDNGAGMPDEIDFGKTSTLGLHLVHLLAVDQLGGDIFIDRQNGTAIKIVFES